MTVSEARDVHRVPSSMTELVLRAEDGKLLPSTPSVGPPAGAEIEPPGREWGTYRARLELGAWRSEWFSWAVIGADAVADVAAAAGLAVCDLATFGGRWFATLRLQESGRFALSA